MFHVISEHRAASENIRWRARVMTGVAIMIGKTLLVSILILVTDPTFRTSEVIGKIGLVCLGLGFPGAVGGLAYASTERFGAKYYTRWIVAAEVTALILLLEVRVTIATFFSGQKPESQQAKATFFLFTSPIGWMALAGIAAIGGVIYGKASLD